MIWTPRSESKIRLTYGAHDLRVEAFDLTVGEQLLAYRDIINAPDSLEAYLNGQLVNFDARTLAGDRLEFIKPYGDKGAQPVGRRIQTDDPNDFYPTPPHATRALLAVEQFGSTVWEPACGDGAISRVLRAEGYRVISSDLVNRGYGEVADFFRSRRNVESIVTNPPYKLAEEFVRRALDVTSFKVAMLLRLSFLESQGRYSLFQETPLESVYVFSRRLSLHRGMIVTGRSTGAFPYAWYVWRHGYRGEPRIRWISPDQSNP
jgi:hypothetical protein